jgi:hypothetical protein
MNKLINYLRRVYRLSVNFKKHEDVVWNDLKNLVKHADWRAGVFEKEKCIELSFEIGENMGGHYVYFVHNNTYSCRVKVATDFPPEQAEAVFILASHFNNLLNHGMVYVNPEGRYISYVLECNLLIPLLYPGELHTYLLLHYNTSKNVYWAFQRLLNEDEAPAIIIADLLKKNEEERKEE